MKHIFTLFICFLLLNACKKENALTTRNYLENVKVALKDSLQPVDFSGLDFTRSVQSKVDSVQMNVLRVPFKNKKLENDFVIVETDEIGTVKQGKIIHLEGAVIENENDKLRRRTWNGEIIISSLDRTKVINSPINNGFITAFRSQNNLRSSVHPDNVMPEVVITYVIPSGSSGMSWSSWFLMQSFFADYSGNNWDGYYGSLGGGGGSFGGGGGSPSGGGYPIGGGSIEQDPPIQIDIETVLDKAEIDLQKFINCFTSIPDAGANCSIEIFADIPVDRDPNKIFNFETQSPGHTFLQIKKSNGSQSAIQNIGFYPKNDWKSILTNAPIDGKFVDNGGHEYNTSFKMNLTPGQLTSILTQILYLKNSKYDIDNFNCTDWALDVFNKVRTDKLQIPLYDIPGNVPSLGTRTPNGVYNKLREMKTSGHPEASNINYDFLKGYAANSTGPCN
ncbi:MAG TPA: hypothetical protein VMR70_13450 [Flavisolibacter sp.]|nr:hypothetical protein [Flavisolibacter sp.]